MLSDNCLSFFLREIFGGEGTKIVKRLHDSDSDEDEPSAKKVVPSSGKPTDILAEVKIHTCDDNSVC